MEKGEESLQFTRASMCLRTFSFCLHTFGELAKNHSPIDNCTTDFPCVSASNILLPFHFSGRLRPLHVYTCTVYASSIYVCNRI